MKLFLDDETAINKLVASQYKIVPEKLLRQGAYNGQQSKHRTTAQHVPDPFHLMSPPFASSSSSCSLSPPDMSPFQICALPAGVQAKLGQGLQGRGQDFRGLNGQ